MRFLIRHWTATIVVLVLIGWAVFYLPATPSFAIFQLKRAVDARDAQTAARYVDFVSVVRHAGYEMLKKREQAGGASGSLAELIGRSAVDALAAPAADALRAWAERQVAQGSPKVQIPAAAAAGAILLLHRDGDSAYTRFTDRKGQTWEIHFARDGHGQWQVTQVDNIAELLERLERSNAAVPAAPPP